MKKALITGITGQDGAYLTKLLLDKGYEVTGLSRKDTPDLSKLSYLGIEKRIKVFQCDLANKDEILKIIKKVEPDEIYNLAGQSSVDYSFKEPEETIRWNILSVLNILESIRITNTSIKMYQASTSEMYGNDTVMPINELSRMEPSNPYGVSKAAGFMMVKNYRETFGLFCVNGILFNHESHLRSPHYFIRRLIRTAINISNGKDEYVYLGQQENKRDFGYSPYYVEATWKMLQQDKANDYVICSGKPISIREITEYVLEKFKISNDRIKIDKSLFRFPNVPVIYGNSDKARNDLDWKYDMSFFEVLDILIEEELKANQ